MAAERPLAGGFNGPVSRVGETVRRSAGPWTPTVHSLLSHLRARGFTLAPRPLGYDERGREVLSYLEGQVPLYPLPEWCWRDSVLVEVARTLRKAHDATLDFHPAEPVWRVTTDEPADVICHNDFAPYNLVFRDGRLTGVIDWDFASPGPRAWDLGYTAYRFVPLTAAANPDTPTFPVAEQRRRLQLLCESYGTDHVTPEEVLERAEQRLAEAIRRIVSLRHEAAEPYRRGHHVTYAQDLEHLWREREALVAPPHPQASPGGD
jgi:hypothetical protein